MYRHQIVTLVSYGRANADAMGRSRFIYHLLSTRWQCTPAPTARLSYHKHDDVTGEQPVDPHELTLCLSCHFLVWPHYCIVLSLWIACRLAADKVQGLGTLIPRIEKT